MIEAGVGSAVTVTSLTRHGLTTPFLASTKPLGVFMNRAAVFQVRGGGVGNEGASAALRKAQAAMVPLRYV